MANISGTWNADVLNGTADADTINGLEGNDTINGLDGDDDLKGGAGNDVITGGRGNDTKAGGSGKDTFIWNNGDGSDTMNGGGNTDTQEVNGAPAGDEFQVANENGKAEFDRVNLGQFSLTMDNVETLDVRGLDGDDRFRVSDLSHTDVSLVIFQGGEGKDRLEAAQATTSIHAFGGGGDDFLETGSGDDRIVGGPGADIITYHGGKDVVEIDWADDIRLSNWEKVTPAYSNGSLVLNFGDGDTLTLKWSPGAFAGPDFFNANVFAFNPAVTSFIDDLL